MKQGRTGYKDFLSRVDEEVKSLCQIPKVEEIDLYFFPVYMSQHFYVVCYNVRDMTCHYIDNKVVAGMDKYTKVPEKLVSALTTYT